MTRWIVIMQVYAIRIGVIVGAVALAGCNSPPKVQPGSAAAPAPAVSWDGTYRGTVQITGLGSGMQRSWCETDPQIVIQVSGNSFTYAMPHPNAPDNPTPIYSATIAPNGTFNTQIASGMMSGRVADSRMSGTISGAACVYAFSADRS
jgi:hypothetical protein